MRQMAIVAVLLALFAPAWAQDLPDMIGNWTGYNEGGRFENITSSEASGGFTYMGSEEVGYTFIITEQKGASFVGKKISIPGPYTESVVGVIGFDNKSISMVDEEGIWWGEFTSPTVMEMYYQETGNYTMRAERGIYTKE